MLAQGYSTEEIGRGLGRKRIPLDSPANDIVYRTPDEVKRYDRIADRVVFLIRRKERDVYDRASLLETTGREPNS